MFVIPSYNPSQAGPGVTVRMMTEQTVDETISTVICPSPSCKNHTFSITFPSGSPLSGALQLETAPSFDYAGAWSPLGGGPIDLAALAGVALELAFSNIVIKAVRGRLTDEAGAPINLDYTGGQ